MNGPDQKLSEDAAREARIEQIGASMVLSSDLTERARLWRELKAEIMARSPAQVLRLEREKGLR
jgi:hypothetical protein